MVEWWNYMGAPKRNRNFVIKKCLFIFRCYKCNHVQSTVHLMQCTGINVFSTFRSSPETLAKWCLLIPPSFFSSPLPRPQNVFLWGLLSFGGIKRSRTERDRVNMVGGEAGSSHFWLKIDQPWAREARILLQLFSFAIPRSKSAGRNSRTHQTSQQDRQLFCNGIPRSVHEFSRCFHPFGRSRSPWARLVCKWQFTIPEAGKPLVNLCFPQCSFLVTCFKHYNCFP